VIAERLRDFWRDYALQPATTLVALSGGVDSTALLVATMEADIAPVVAPVVAGHVNHHLRGDESDDDERFVRDLCRRLDVPLQVADGTLDAQLVREVGVEAAAREIRFARLEAMREAASATYIATAHQKNDQAETVLMRLMAGGGIAAMQGIRPIRGAIIRPLLAATRDELDDFLRQRGIEPRADSSNADPRFLRNRVRALLRELGPGAVDNLAALADQVRAQWPAIERGIDAVDDSVINANETRFRSLPDDPWLRQALLHRHIHRLDPRARDVSARDLQRLAIEVASVKRISVTKNLEIVRRGEEIVLRRRPEAGAKFEQKIALGETAHGITVRQPGNRQPATLFQLPRGAEASFTVRNRRNGDRVSPHKKLKDLLIDRKIDADSRDTIPLLLWNERIVWVPGVGVTEAFRVTSPPGDLYEASIEEDQEGVQREGDRAAGSRARS
jgi:tRNA(Ile)-lysidine synthase